MIEFEKETATFTQEEVDECNENLDNIYHELSISVPIPDQNFGSITAKWGMGAHRPPNMSPEKFQNWVRMEVKRKIQWLYERHKNGKV